MTEGRLELDLRELLDETPAPTWDAFARQRIFLTGGTGFVGKWLLHALLHADQQLGLGLHLTVLSRDPDAFVARHPAFAPGASLAFHRGDLQDFSFPDGSFDGVIHAALPVAAPGSTQDRLFELARAGTQRVCEFAVARGVRRVLHISSGAVYGLQPVPGDAIAESAPWNETSPANAYSLAKRAAERVISQPWPFEVVVARLFGFIGPYLLPSSGMASAEFTDRAARGQDILVQGTGEALRSFQYASEMARWLIVLYAQGPAGMAFNVGGTGHVSIAQFARMVAASATPPVAVHIASGNHTGLAPNSYFPSTTLAAEMLGLRNIVSLPEAVRRTLLWHSQAT